MQASGSDIEHLYELQQIDLDLNRVAKQLDGLPQREIILNAREKQALLKDKRSTISALKNDVRKKISKMKDEDASLEKKEHGVQAAIEAAGGDYRGVEARTKELNGIFKRRQALKESLDKELVELGKVTSLESQVDQAILDASLTENQATESFKREGGALKIDEANLASRKKEILSQLSREVADAYEAASNKAGSVTIGRLEDSKCSVCRTRIESGKLIELRAQAPLGRCYSCGRLLIIDI